MKTLNPTKSILEYLPTVDPAGDAAMRAMDEAAAAKTLERIAALGIPRPRNRHEWRAAARFLKGR